MGKSPIQKIRIADCGYGTATDEYTIERIIKAEYEAGWVVKQIAAGDHYKVYILFEKINEENKESL